MPLRLSTQAETGIQADARRRQWCGEIHVSGVGGGRVSLGHETLTHRPDTLITLPSVEAVRVRARPWFPIRRGAGRGCSER